MVSCLCPQSQESAPWPRDGSRADHERQKPGRCVIMTSENAPQPGATHRPSLRVACVLRLRDQVHNDFGVAVGLEDRSLALQSGANAQSRSPGSHCALVRSPLLDSTRIGWAFSRAESPAVE